MTPFVIVAAFPGTGKSFAAKKLTEAGKNVLDSDSSKFPKDQFPQNYLTHIADSYAMLDVDHIFVSTHQPVLDGLCSLDFQPGFTLVYPNECLKDVYLERYRERGSPEGLVNLMADKFNEFVADFRRFAESHPEVDAVEFKSADQTIYRHFWGEHES